MKMAGDAGSGSYFQERILTGRIPGIGLTAEEQARLFEPFFRGSRAEVRRERGTGLGLALVHAVARRLGCEVRVVSSAGKGSTFTLWLPLRPGDSEARD
jgi:signal transduction histidine kinase